jgi:hypothetical protein
MGSEATTDTDFVHFWNSVLEPKFTKYRHILQGGDRPPTSGPE